MKALSLHEPWASLVAFGYKRNETRSWAPPVGDVKALIAIHVTKNPKFTEAIHDLATEAGWSEHGLDNFLCAARRSGYGWPHGLIIAVAELVAVSKTEETNPSPQERAFGDYSPGRFAWHFGKVTRLNLPVPCRGFQGLWYLPPEIKPLVLNQASQTLDDEAEGASITPLQGERHD